MERRDEICLKELRTVLADFDKSEYSLSGERDCTICLEFIDNKWGVYECERASKRDFVCYNTIVEACLDNLAPHTRGFSRARLHMIKRLAQEADISLLTNKFLDVIMQIKITS